MAPERYELHYQDETHVETNPYLAKQWHRIGTQQRIPSVGVNRRVTVFGSRAGRARGRIEVVCGGQDSACFAQYLAALDGIHRGLGGGPLHLLALLAGELWPVWLAALTLTPLLALAIVLRRPRDLAGLAGEPSSSRWEKRGALQASSTTRRTRERWMLSSPRALP